VDSGHRRYVLERHRLIVHRPSRSDLRLIAPGPSAAALASTAVWSMLTSTAGFAIIRRGQVGWRHFYNIRAPYFRLMTLVF
jgi:hypothetical protein